MGPADLRPLPIPLLVRYKLIDSRDLYGCAPGVPIRPVCRGYSIRARASGRLKSAEKSKKETREEEKERKEQTVKGGGGEEMR